jgi:hypothetical protein
MSFQNGFIINIMLNSFVRHLKGADFAPFFLFQLIFCLILSFLFSGWFRFGCEFCESGFDK